MAEYWKSNPRRMCDVCKVWMADNKSSIQIHEGGKKHKESVQRRISQARKRGVEEIHEKDEIQRQLAELERAALEAYKKDVESDPMLASLGVPARQFGTARRENFRQQTADNEASSTQQVEGVEEKGGEGDPVVNSTWCAYSTEDGYVYYSNHVTGETTWNKPEGFTNDAPPVVVPADSAESVAETSDAKCSPAASPAEASGTDGMPVASNDTDGVPVASSAAATSAESVSISTKRKADEVAGWSGDGAIITMKTSDDECEADSQCSSNVSSLIVKKESASGGFAKKPVSARDAAFGGWSTVSVSSVTSARLNEGSASSKQSVRVKSEGGGGDGAVLAGGSKEDDDDGLSASLTCRDHEDDESRFKFKEKTLASSIDCAVEGVSSSSSGSAGMFKKRKRAGGRRGRNDDD